MNALALAALCVAANAGATEGWELRSNEDGIRVESQAVPGSGYERLRAEATCSHTPRLMMKALWGTADDTSNSPEVVKRDVLVDEAHVRRYHDLVHSPPVSDRDYVVQLEWSEDAATGVVTMTFHAVDDARKPPSPSVVRFPSLEGTAVFAPRPAGGCTFTYTAFTDVGGSIPAWMVRGTQRDRMRGFMRFILRRADALAAAGPKDGPPSSTKVHTEPAEGP